jgi:undecaprenyl phosphate-alpha-L-ara4N flippase subunit ArnF
MLKYLYIFATILFTVYGQIILKWRILKLGWQMSGDDLWTKIKCYCALLFDPFILSGFLSAFIASICWVIAMTKFEITTAYPFMSIAPAIVFLIGVLVLNETFTVGKLLGLILIITGTVITVKL